MIKAADLRGVIVPIVTPVTGDDTVDYPGLRRVVRHVVDGGVHGVFVMGGTGNFCSFTAEERFEISRTVVQEVAGKVPVLVGCMDSHTRLMLRNLKLAAEAGADAAVIEPPYYYPSREADLLNHFRLTAEATRLPIVIYNIPEANKTVIDVNLTRKLAAIPGIIGMKDSTMDFRYFQDLVAAFGGSDFALIQGQEPLAGYSLLAGGNATILAIGNVAPNLAARLCETAAAGKFEETKPLQAQLMKAFSICQDRSNESGADAYYGVTVASFFTGLHCAMKILGVCDNLLTVPYTQPPQATYDRVKGILSELGAI